MDTLNPLSRMRLASKLCIVGAWATFFFFLVLYALGALLNYVSAPKKAQEEGVTPPRMKNMPEEDDAQLEITPIQKMR